MATRSDGRRIARKPARAIKRTKRGDDLPRLYPLPVAWLDCTSPDQLIPDAALSDPLGKGARALAIARELRVTEGEFVGRRFGELLAPWQARLIVALFGHTDADGRRIIRRAYLKVAKKNGKTALASVLSMVAALTSTEGRPQTLCLGGARDQSRLAFENVAAMIESDAVLRRRFRIARHQYHIYDNRNGGTIVAASAELTATVGAGASVAIIDELHILGSLGTRGANLVRAVESGQHARAEPLLIYITTASIDEPAGIYRDVDDYAHRVAQGDVDDRRFLPVLFEVPAELDATDPANWWRSNPNLGVTLQLPRLLEARAIAIQRGADDERQFDSQNLNIDPRARSSSAAWITPATEFDPFVEALDFDATMRDADAVACGVDIGGADDVSALAILARIDGVIRCFVRGYLSERGYKLRRDKADYDTQIADGSLVIVDRVGDDVEAIVRAIEAIKSANPLIGADAYMMKAAASRLEALGLSVVGVPQGWRLTGWLDSFERDLLGGVLRFAPSALARDHFGACTIEQRGEARALTKPDARRKGAAKIDAAIATLCGYAALAAAKRDDGVSVLFIGGAADEEPAVATAAG